MTQYLGEEVYKVVALTLAPDFLSFYDTTDKHPPPVDHPNTYNPVSIGDVGFMPETAAFAARDAGDVLIFLEHTPQEIEEAVRIALSTETFALVPATSGANGAYVRGVNGSLAPATLSGININYLGSYGPNWARFDMDQQIPDIGRVYIQFDGFPGEATLSWDTDRYHGVMSQGANPTNFQDWIVSMAGQEIIVDIRT